ncbi:MAG: hypothetical protein ABSB83_03265 [Methanomassiliicoccales archaeon]
MNESDTILMRFVLDAVDHVGSTGLVLLNVRSTQFMKIHLVLLSGLLEEKGMRGIFISVDRPHQYIVHLSRMHKINIGGLTFIDVISRYSGDTKIEQGQIGLLAGPFNINDLPSALATWVRSVGWDTLDQCKGEFVIIDNPASLVPYNNFLKVEFLLSNLMGIFGERKNILVPLIIDGEKSAHLYEAMKPLCVGEVDVEKLMASASGSNKNGIRDAKIEFKGTGE